MRKCGILLEVENKRPSSRIGFAITAIFLTAITASFSLVHAAGTCSDVFVGETRRTSSAYSEILPTDSQYTVLDAQPDQFGGYIFRSVPTRGLGQGDPAERLAATYPKYMKLLGYETSGEAPIAETTYHPNWQSLKNRIQVLKILGFDISYLPTPIRPENYDLTDRAFTNLRARGLFPYVISWFHEARDHTSVSLPFGRFFRMETRKLALIEQLENAGITFKDGGRRLKPKEFYHFRSGNFERISGSEIYSPLLDSHSTSESSAKNRSSLLDQLLDIGKALVAKLGEDYSLMPIQSERELAEQFLKKAEADRADGKTLEILRQAVRWSSPETLSEKEGAEELTRVLQVMEDPTKLVPNLSVELMIELFGKLKDVDNLSSQMEIARLEGKNLTLVMKVRASEHNVAALRAVIEKDDGCRIVRIFRGMLIVEGPADTLRTTMLRPEIEEVSTGLE